MNAKVVRRYDVKIGKENKRNKPEYRNICKQRTCKLTDSYTLEYRTRNTPKQRTVNYKLLHKSAENTNAIDRIKTRVPKNGAPRETKAIRKTLHRDGP